VETDLYRRNLTRKSLFRSPTQCSLRSHGLQLQLEKAKLTLWVLFFFHKTLCEWLFKNFTSPFLQQWLLTQNPWNLWICRTPTVQEPGKQSCLTYPRHSSKWLDQNGFTSAIVEHFIMAICQQTSSFILQSSHWARGMIRSLHFVIKHSSSRKSFNTTRTKKQSNSGSARWMEMKFQLTRSWWNWCSNGEAPQANLKNVVGKNQLV
jgi:hypothetical protein